MSFYFKLSEGTNAAWKIDKPNSDTHSDKQLASHVIQVEGPCSTPLLGKWNLSADFETEANKATSKKIRIIQKLYWFQIQRVAWQII